jgi:hypothetical protein
MAKVTLKYENLPKGQSVEVAGLGLFPNGATSNVDDFQVVAWESATGRQFPGDGLMLPEPPPPPNPTDAQTEQDRQNEIIEKQNARTPEQVAKDEKETTFAEVKRGMPVKKGAK